MPAARILADASKPLFEVDYSMTLDEVVVATLSYIDRQTSKTGPIKSKMAKTGPISLEMSKTGLGDFL